jgi:hypothetical protein
MTGRHPKIEHRLKNGDVLIIATTKRDPKVDAAFKDAVSDARASNHARFVEFQRGPRTSS